MPYIKFMEYPRGAVGRQFRSVATHPDTSEMFAEVDEVLPGEQEVGVNEHSRVMLAAMAAYEAEAAAREAVIEQ